ncbi:MAG TPA: signal peptidase II [Kofleriaceae bacterium]|nr:signal peptidase II [Kofleriaceae bacterium]
MHLRRLAVFVTIALVVLGLDQASKAWARTLPTAPAGCAPADLAARRCAGVPQPVIAGYWDWELAMNDGVAFSTFAGGSGRIILCVIAGLAVLAIGYAAARTAPEERLRRVCYGLLAAGALGNLVDRVKDGAVTDFVRWHVHTHMWPIFNLADAALLVGVGMLFLVRPRRAIQSPA